MVCTQPAAAVEEAKQGVQALQVYQFTSLAGPWDPAKCLSGSASQQLVVCAWEEHERRMQCSLSKGLSQQSAAQGLLDQSCLVKPSMHLSSLSLVHHVLNPS